ncbi:MAG: DUF86 domain-containing protein [Prevotellaceae bacterium]|jgi:uncharacterized protein with HEPN domain|nr:DUF86 domain-containing protein [Prevotellaceae bacterium]
MYDKSLLLNSLQYIAASLQKIIERTADVTSVDDFVRSPSGMDLLDIVCMKLFAVGETVKAIDKHTNNSFLSRYSSVNWQEIMRMRDIIAHHYFEIDANRVFNTVRNDILPLLQVIEQMKEDLKFQDLNV